MRDIKNIKLLYLKGSLFLFGCIVASGLLLIDSPKIRTAILLIVALWFGARFYYFMFYVIENYIDENYKYTGILSFLKYLLAKKRKNP